jgi:hypothetical protein
MLYLNNEIDKYDNKSPIVTLSSADLSAEKHGGRGRIFQGDMAKSPCIS